jgi:very-short-patch-repair endonuclease
MNSLSRKLRQNPTKAEYFLWEALKTKKFFGRHFRRQAPFGRFIFDFYCPEKKLAIELDGESHLSKIEYDSHRQEFVNSFGIKILRFQNLEIDQDISAVLNKIAAALV